ncbi:MAG: asparaginase [Janthinobacterium lividum]
MSALPRVAVIGTGGTISGVGKDRLDLYEYGTTGRFMHVEELVAGVPELARVADITARRYLNVGSGSIGPAEWLQLVGLIHAAVAADPGLAGVVVTHGTATLEETAYFLNLAVKVPVPVVVVGAMRPSTALGADGGMNLLNAVRVASTPLARGMGVLVVLNDEINAARDVTKTSNYRVQTFVTRDFGMLGYADGDQVVFYRRPVRRSAPDTEFDVAGLEALPRVDIIPAYAGAEEGLGRGGQVGRGGGSVLPLRQRPGDRQQGGGAQRRLSGRRQPHAAEGAHPADARADRDHGSRRDPADVRRVLGLRTTLENVA